MELTGARRRGGLPVERRINGKGARASWPAVACPVERRVMPYAAGCRRSASELESQKRALLRLVERDVCVRRAQQVASMCSDARKR